MATSYLLDDSGKHENEEMGNAQKESAEFGPLGIIRESFKIYKNNDKALIYIELTLGLVPIIMARVFAHVVFLYASSKLPLGTLGSNLKQEQLFFTPSPSVFLHEAYPGPEIVLVMMLASFVSIVAVAIDALSMSAHIYVVGAVFIGKRVSFISAFKGVIPRLWKRLVLTQTYVLLIMHLVIFFVLVLHFLFWYTGLSDSILIFLPIVVVALCCLAIVSLVSAGSSILDDKYGWAAIKTSSKLLQGKKRVAYFIFLMNLASLRFFAWLEGQNDALFNNPWHPVHLLLAAIQFVLFILVRQLCMISAGVAYVSFKAYHNEALSSEFFLKDGTEDYERPSEHHAATEVPV